MKSFVDLIHSNGDSQDETDSENEEYGNHGSGKAHHRLETIAELRSAEKTNDHLVFSGGKSKEKIQTYITDM